MKDGKCTVDYKDTRILQKLVTPQGKLFSRKRSGACAYCQRKLKIAVKRARTQLLIALHVGDKIEHLVGAGHN